MPPSTRTAPNLLIPAFARRHNAIVAGFTTRQGGISLPPLDTFNLGLIPDADPEAVRENRQRLCTALGVSPERMVTARQVHGNTVRVVDAPGAVPDCDSLVTTSPGLVLCIQTADCAAVLLADPARRVIGACHAGWRGTVAGVAAETVATMTKHGAEASSIHAYISPCISADRFEVGPEVARQFDDAVVHHPPGAAKPHVDLKQAIVRQLQTAGVKAAHIEVSPHCTASEPDRFFSYRAEDGTTGRLMGCIALRHS